VRLTTRCTTFVYSMYKLAAKQTRLGEAVVNDGGCGLRGIAISLERKLT
jgi:hypothetical protein